MTTLYNCHTDGDQFRCTKFDSLGNVESTYLCTETECECPAGQRPTCRHRQMLPLFLKREAVNTFWFYDFDRKGWVTNEPAGIMETLVKSSEVWEQGPVDNWAKSAAETDSLPTPEPSPPPFRRRV